MAQTKDMSQQLQKAADLLLTPLIGHTSTLAYDSRAEHKPHLHKLEMYLNNKTFDIPANGLVDARALEITCYTKQSHHEILHINLKPSPDQEGPLRAFVYASWKGEKNRDCFIVDPDAEETDPHSIWQRRAQLQRTIDELFSTICTHP